MFMLMLEVSIFCATMIVLMLFCLLPKVLCTKPEEESDEITSQTEPEMVITSNSIDIDELIYAGIPRFDEIILPSISDGNKTYRRPKNDLEISMDSLPILITADLDPITSQYMTYDVMEFNKLNSIVTNLTRRFNGRWQGYTDPEDWPQKIEPLKIQKMDNVALQFLVHARYQIKKVLVQKEKFRGNIRYKIGYLFNRLRRIRYEQLKIVTVAENQLHTNLWQDLPSLMRFYEKVVRMDIDVKDTIRWIKDLHKESEKIKDEEAAMIAKPKKP